MYRSSKNSSAWTACLSSFCCWLHGWMIRSFLLTNRVSLTQQKTLLWPIGNRGMIFWLSFHHQKVWDFPKASTLWLLPDPTSSNPMLCAYLLVWNFTYYNLYHCMLWPPPIAWIRSWMRQIQCMAKEAEWRKRAKNDILTEVMHYFSLVYSGRVPWNFQLQTGSSYS